jgi:photosystem II stability/assembly factor-like uncharacterized protein
MRVVVLLVFGGGLDFGQPTARPAAPAKPALEFTGKPLQLSAVCGTKEIDETGLACDEDNPCPILVELAGVEAAGARIFLAGNFHTPTVTLWSLLLMSGDGGRTWTEPWPRQLKGGLEQIQFIDFANGWVSGHTTGTLPHDPFLLKTADGGKTWRRRPLFDDQTSAVIDQFWFESAQEGKLIVSRTHSAAGGRHQLLETRDGGETWMLRETSKEPIPGPAPREANPAWRIRADARTKALHIERREQSGWAEVAAFEISAGACKATPPAPEEPPPGEPK